MILFGKNGILFFFDYACRTNSTEVNLNFEGQEYVWVGIEEAMKLPVELYTKKVIEGYLRL